MPKTFNLVAFFRGLKNGVLGVLEISEKKNTKPQHKVIQVAALLLALLQLLSFVTSDLATSKWPSSLSPIQTITSLTNMSGYKRYVSPGALQAAVWVAILWTGVLVVVMVWGVWCFSKNSFPFLWPLDLLTFMGYLSSDLLFIPLLQILLNADCALAYADGCTAFGQYSQLTATLFCAIFLILIALLFKGVFYNPAMFTNDFRASSHGRHSIVMLGVQIVLAVHGNLNKEDGPLRIAMTTVCGAVWLAAHVYFMPYHLHAMNRAWIAGALVFLSAVCCLAVLLYSQSSADAALLFYLLVPTSIGCGVALADWRATWIQLTPADRLNTPFEADVKGRYLTHEALFGHPLYHSEHFRLESLRSAARRLEGAPLLGVGSLGGGGAGTMGSAAFSPHAAAHANAVAAAAAATASAKVIAAGDVAESGLLGRVPPDKAAAILELYRGATARFERNAFAHLFASRAYAVIAGNRHLQMSHLLQATRCSPSLDVAFTIFQNRRELENDALQKRGGASVSAMSRVAFEKHAADARRNVQRAAGRQLAFWAELAEPTPDITRLYSMSAETQKAVLAAEADFAQLFALSPQALTQMRMYAAFNLHVTGNVERATVLLGEAERIEDSRSREHRTEAGTQQDILAESPLDVWSESTAILTISSNVRDLGVIQSINSAACRLFGYSRIQLERRSIFALMPPVLDRVHEESLRSYSKSGESELGFVDTRA